MAFRDETEALRARVTVLERELAAAQRQLEELSEVRAERDRLEAQVRSLEAELSKLRPAPKPAPKPAPRPKAPSSERSRKNLVLAATAAIVLVTVGGFWLADQSGLVGIDEEGAPTAGMVELATHPAPPPLPGSVRGEHAASSLADECRGYVSQQPLLVLRANEPTSVRVATRSSTDLVLAVVDAEGRVRCDDDSGDGSNAALSLTLGPGDTRVWVGTFAEGATASFELLVNATAAGEMPDESGIASEGAPTLGTLEPAEESTAHMLSGVVEGFAEASRVSPGCRGFVPVAPQALLRLREPRIVRATTTAPIDLVMLVRSAGGTVRCDDDGGGSMQPLVAAVLPAGVHRIWVGTFQGGATAPYELHVTTRSVTAAVDEHGLATRSEPRLGRFALEDQPLYSVSDTARGLVPTSGVGEGCGGFVQPEPDLELTLGARRDVTLTPTPDGSVELLVQRPDGSLSCARGAVRATWGPGSHRVWVGARSHDAATPFTLVVASTTPSVTPYRP